MMMRTTLMRIMAATTTAARMAMLPRRVRMMSMTTTSMATTRSIEFCADGVSTTHLPITLTMPSLITWLCVSSGLE